MKKVPDNLIGYGPRLMKRMSLVRISLSFPCGHVKEKKRFYEKKIQKKTKGNLGWPQLIVV
jgi:hypothetical protein